MKLIKVIIFTIIPLFLQADILAEIETYLHARQNFEALPNGDHCGFRYQVMLQQHVRQLSGKLRTMAAQYLEEPVRQKYIISPSGFFTLGYDTSGTHAVPLGDISGNHVPDYIDSAAVILDHVWNEEIGRLGFDPPPDTDGRPVTNYHVFFTRFSWYGLTSFSFDDDIPELPGNNFTSYLELHCDYEGSQFETKGLDALRVTAAHEFNHAIQLGYNFRIDPGDYYPDLFFMEMTSTLMEEQVYPNVNDYIQYLTRFVPNIASYNFDRTDGNSEYANTLYLHMLREQYGDKAIVDIWDNIRDYPAIEAIDRYLALQNSSFAESHNLYACWLYFTGDRANPQISFPEGELYPQITLKSGTDELVKPLNPWRMRFINQTVEESSIYQSLLTANLASGRFNHIANGQRFTKPAMINAYQWFSQDRNAPLIVVLTNSGENVFSEIDYDIQSREVTTAGNPVRVSAASGSVKFLNVPEGSRLFIYSVDGRLILRMDNTDNSSGLAEWDGRDLHNRPVASGTYFYIVDVTGRNQSGKFVLLH